MLLKLLKEISIGKNKKKMKIKKINNKMMMKVRLIVMKKNKNRNKIKRIMNLKKGSRKGSVSSTEESDDEEIIEESKPFKEKDEKGNPLYIHALKNINLSIKKGQFTMIIGDIGSGKSSLLQAIINEIITAKNSKVNISGTIAYSAQKPWIISRKLKENITFTSPFDE